MAASHPNDGPRRRLVLGMGLALLGQLGLGCGSPPAPPPPAVPVGPRPLTVARLTDLLPTAGLRWLVELAPEQLLSLQWLKPALARVLRDERLDLLASATGVDLRQVPALAIASYGQDDAVLQLTRHRGDPLELERKFRQRLTSEEQRSVDDRVQLSRAAGRIGTKQRVFVAIGADVVGYQYDGDVERGPARVAGLLATGALRRTTTVAADPDMGPLWTELGPAPIRAALLGPFEEELAAGARGLMQVATGLAAAATPIQGGGLHLLVLLGGDFSSAPAKAQSLMLAAWNDLGASDLGHLLGLHRPRRAPQARLDARRLRLDVEVDAAAVFDGLAAATTDSIRDIMQRTPKGADEPHSPEPPEQP